MTENEMWNGWAELCYQDLAANKPATVLSELLSSYIGDPTGAKRLEALKRHPIFELEVTARYEEEGRR